MTAQLVSLAMNGDLADAIESAALQGAEQTVRALIRESANAAGMSADRDAIEAAAVEVVAQFCRIHARSLHRFEPVPAWCHAECREAWDRGESAGECIAVAEFCACGGELPCRDWPACCDGDAEG